MSSDSPEPENYSISEMMDRLKERSSTDRSNGELVVRADGTQAIKVRGRKRRSKQAQREDQQKSRRARAVQLVGLIVVVVALLLAAGGLVIYMNGSAYRNKVMGRITEATGATAESEQFRVTPIGSDAGALSLEWPQGSSVRKLRLQGVSSELRFTSFLGKTWNGEEATAQKGDLSIVLPSAEGPPDRSLATDLFKFNRFRCAKLMMSFGDPKAPAMIVDGCEFSLYPKGANARPELRINSGRVKFRSQFPDLMLDRTYIGVIGKQLDIVKLRLFHPDSNKSEILLSGKIEPANRMSTLDAEIQNFPLEYLTNGALGNLLRGNIQTREVPNSNFMSFDPAKPEAARVVIAFSGGYAASPLVLAQLPMLKELRRMFNDDTAYENPSLDIGSTGVLRINGADISIDELRLNVKNRMAIRGALAVAANKTLSGHLELGLPMKVVSDDPRLDAAFGSPREEMRWLDVTLSGTASAPADDFARKVPARIGAMRAAPETPAPAARDAASEFEKLTQPKSR